MLYTKRKTQFSPRKFSYFGRIASGYVTSVNILTFTFGKLRGFKNVKEPRTVKSALASKKSSS